jgi:hypothetical protein
VQIGAHDYVGVYALPDGRPELPATHAAEYHAVPKRNGSWCFLPNGFSSVPPSWEMYSMEPPEPIASNSASDSESQEVKPQAAEKTTEPKEMQETKDTSSSDHPIPGSPDDPISSESPEDIMDQLEQDIARYLVCSQHQRVVLALWILHTYCYFRAAPVTPYLNIYSPIEQSGKSACLGVLRGFCAQPWYASGVSASTLTRKIIAHRPTVLLDNWHTTFRGRDQQQITGFLLHGAQIFQPFTVLEKGLFREVDVYCPKAFAGLASLPPTLAQRSIPIMLQRCRPQEVVTPTFTLLDPKVTRPFTSWAQKWTNDNMKTIDYNTANLQHRQSLGVLSPHQQACGQPLLGLAETIGGEWLQRARAALLEIFRAEQDREVSALQLLSDMRDAFAHHRNPERLFTHEVLDYLHSLDHRTWHEWNKGQPMNAHALSGLLRKHFNIYSRSQRRDKQKRRGYQQSDFIEAWERYLPGPDTEPDADAEDALGNVAAESIEAETGRKGRQESVVPGADSLDVQLPNYQLTQLPNGFRPTKSRLVSMSQFKAEWKKRWFKSRSALKQFAGKAIGLFVTTRT